jgi:chromate reductase
MPKYRRSTWLPEPVKEQCMNLVAISGSLRRESLNTRLAQAALALAPAGTAVELLPLHGIPLYDEDLRVKGVPGAVTVLAGRIASADGVLIVTPEYNYSVSGALKNALDWLSRLSPAPLAGKPTAIMSASPGLFGGVRAQDHLRQILFGLDARVLTRPQVIVNQADSKFAADGSVSDTTAVELIRTLMEALTRAGGSNRAHTHQ